ncbi:Hypothetical protein SCF082_LOCUS14933, partial [Durusdinium trenchii]
ADGKANKVNVSAHGLERIEAAIRAASAVESASGETGRASPSESLADRARQYLERRQQRENLRVEQEEAKTREQVREKPEINPNSARIAAEGRVRGGDLGHALHAEAEAQRLNKEMLAKEHFEGSMLATPAITKQAAELVREGSVGDRLYQQAVAKNNQKSDAHQQKARPPKENAEVISHAEALYRSALDAKRAREEAERLRQSKLRQKAKPRLTKKTKQIAADLGQTSRERLLKDKRKTDSSLRELRRALDLDEDCTFKPVINPHSKKILEMARGEPDSPSDPATRPDLACPSEASSSTHDRLYNEHTVRQARRESVEKNQLRSKEQEEVEQCTFKPQITHFAPIEEDRKDDQQDIVDRLNEWQRHRSERLEHQRKLKETEDLGEEYTFAPKTNATATRRRSSGHKQSKPAQADRASSVKAQPGFDGFIERQRRAREEKQRIAQAQAGASTSKWSNRITVPIGPKLGTAQRKEEEPQSVTQERVPRTRAVPRQPVPSSRNVSGKPAKSAPMPQRAAPAKLPKRAPPPPPSQSPDERFEYAADNFRETQRGSKTKRVVDASQLLAKHRTSTHPHSNQVDAEKEDQEQDTMRGLNVLKSLLES